MIDGTDNNLVTSSLSNDKKAEAFYHYTQIYNICNDKDHEFSEVLSDSTLMAQLYPMFEELVLDLSMMPHAANDNFRK